MALLLLLGFVVPHVNQAAADEASGKQNQGSVSVDGQSLREFLEVLTLNVCAAYADWNLHEHALTASPGAGVRRGIRDLSHTTSLQNNYTRRKEIVEGLSAREFQREYRESYRWSIGM